MIKVRDPARLRRRAGLACGGLGIAAVLAAGVPTLVSNGTIAVASAARTATVEIANFKFAPPDLTVPVGTTVVWKNADDSPHRVADIGGAYASPALDTEGSFSHIFAAPGVYAYFCSLHPYMKGKIVVEPAGAGS